MDEERFALFIQHGNCLFSDKQELTDPIIEERYNETGYLKLSALPDRDYVLHGWTSPLKTDKIICAFR